MHEAIQPPGKRRLRIGTVLARNTLWNYAGFAINMATNLVLFPYVVRGLGDAAAGIWLLLGAVTGYMGLMELGIVPALTQRIAAAIGGGDQRAIHTASSTALAVMFVMMVVAMQLAWFAGPIAAMLQMPDSLHAAASAAIAIAMIGVALRMPLAVFQALLLGCQRQDRCSQLWIGMALVKATLTALLVSQGRGVVDIVLMEAIVHLAAGVLQVRWTYQELPDLQLRLSAVSGREMTYLMSFGLQVTITGIFVLIVEQTDRLVIGVFRPVAEITLFSAAWKLYALAYTIPTTLVSALTPLAANLHGEGDRERLRDVFVRMSRYTVAVAFPLILGLGVAGGWLLDRWMGASFVAAFPVLLVLLGSLAVTAINHPGYSVVVGTRSVSRQMWVYNAPLAVANLTLSLWLVRELGIVGVALGTAIPALFLEYPFLRLVTSLVGMTVPEFLRLVVAPMALPALVSGALALAAVVVLPVVSPLRLVVAAASALVFALWFWRRGLTDEERARIVGATPWMPAWIAAWLSPAGPSLPLKPGSPSVE